MDGRFWNCIGVGASGIDGGMYIEYISPGKGEIVITDITWGNFRHVSQSLD